MGSEEKTKVVLTKPMSIDDEASNDAKASNILKGMLSFIKDIKPGSDLTKLQIPPQFNCPKSHLQFYGESVYAVSQNVNILERCNSGGTPMERLIAVIAVSLSNMRPWGFGVAPYNPILGETHHVSNGSLNVLLEQVSHHPPITALHATDEKERIQLLWCQHAIPKFYGTSVMLYVKGKRQLSLMRHQETYTTNTPSVVFKFFPVPGVELNGTERIICHESGLEAELSYGGRSFFGIGGRARTVKGKIFESATRKPLFEINGHWDKIVTLQSINSKETRVIYNAKDVVSKLQTPIVVDREGISNTESTVVWADVSEGVISNDWATASRSKKAVEENQRKLSKERKSRGETWVPKHFNISYSKEAGWECSPKREFVPGAPIRIPENTS